MTVATIGIAIAALVMLAVGLFFAMFLTPYFLVPALVLGIAAVASIRPMRPERTVNAAPSVRR